MTYDQSPQECANHPGYAAAGYCPQCAQALCATCLEAHQQDPGRYCPAPTARPRNSTAIVLGVVAGVLLLCLIGLLVATIAYFRPRTMTGPEIVSEVEAPSVLPDLPPAPPALLPPGTPAPPAAPSPAPPALPSGSAREQAAKTVALQGKPGWTAVINWRQPDWSEVRVWIGPTARDLRLSRSLAWDPSLRAYVIMDEGPVPQPPSTRVPPAPSGPQPGEQAALDAALANDPGYAAKVIRHSPDWKQVTVHTGPSRANLTNEYRFHWDDGLKQYVLDHMGAVGSGGGAPRGE